MKPYKFKTIYKKSKTKTLKKNCREKNIKLNTKKNKQLIVCLGKIK